MNEYLKLLVAHYCGLMEQPTDGASELGELNLHDGQVKRYSYVGGLFSMTVLVGDMQRGYDWAQLTYRGAELVELPRDGIRRLRLRAVRTEILESVVTSRQQGFEHRISLWPSRELVIRFDSVDVALSPACDTARR